MPKILVTKGTFDETTTLESNLTANAIKVPQIQEVIHYAEKRQLSTLLCSGAYRTPYQPNSVETRIGEVPKDKLIGGNAYRYNIMGRIQKPSVILQEVGTAGTDGTFELRMKDNLLYPGMNVIFYSGRHARVTREPSGGSGNWVYSMKMIVDGENFDWSTDVAPQPGEFTCFPQYTSYGEASLRGYDRGFYPDQYVNHLTTQRKAIGISGDAATTEVLWYEFNGKKGWLFAKEQQARARFMIEDEVSKWWGISNMRDANGNLLNKSNHIDPETGNEIVQGDGLIEQIRGGNEHFGSAADGSITIDDVIDMMSTLEKRASKANGIQWVIVTGTDGSNTLQTLFKDYARDQFSITMNADSSNTIGGPSVAVGYNFNVLNINGNQVVVVKHPLFDDEERFTEKSVDGKSLQSSQMVFLDMGVEEEPNIEILGKGAFGVSRHMVSAYINGLTGIDKAQTTNSIDGLRFEMLRQNGIFVYNTRTCGLLSKRPA